MAAGQLSSKAGAKNTANSLWKLILSFFFQNQFLNSKLAKVWNFKIVNQIFRRF